MTTFFIGHRGTGKTSFLKRLAGRAFDLDAEIEKRSGKSIVEWFALGEEKFRTVERETLAAVLEESPDFVALGAGFEGPLPEGARVIWLQRGTDSLGRSFFDRPRLEQALSPIAEYRERFFTRERRFFDWASEQLLLPEGYEGGLENLLKDGLHFRYDVTLLPEDFRDWPNFFARRSARHWEVRDDLLSPEQIAVVFRDIPREKIIYSRRVEIAPEGFAIEKSCGHVDWPLELGETPPPGTTLISLHQRGENFTSALERLSSYNLPLKLAVEVKDFNELKAGHEWWMKDPGRRSFLPRSTHGRWRWYRSLFGPRMPLHFVREGVGSSLDQPPLWQALLQPEFHGRFAAVLGSPVEHSRSPMEHREFCQDIPFVAVDLPEEEFSFGLKFLEEIGLAFAAVTAPLKKLAWAQASRLSPEARQTQAANTLYFDHGRILAHNTDVLALKVLHNELPRAESVWLWGGGGVKSSVRQAWPDALEISAREGSARTDSPDLLIWATGRSRKFVYPCPDIRPRLVLDLNYSDDSPGLEWAVSKNLPYQSGLRMFKLQARFQREFWTACAAGESI